MQTQGSKHYALPQYHCENCLAHTSTWCKYCSMALCMTCKESNIAFRCNIGRYDIEDTNGTECVQVLPSNPTVLTEDQFRNQVARDVCTDPFHGDTCVTCEVALCGTCKANSHKCACSTQDEWNHMQQNASVEVLPTRTLKTATPAVGNILWIHRGDPIPIELEECVKAIAVRFNIRDNQHEQWDRQLASGIITMRGEPALFWKAEIPPGYDLHKIGATVMEIGAHNARKYRFSPEP